MTMDITTHHISIHPRDPLIARDGRPFGDGLRMGWLPWLYPSVIAGSLRTLLGNLRGGFDPGSDQYWPMVDSLKRVEIHGCFPAIESKDSLSRKLLLPAPSDAIVNSSVDGGHELYSLVPERIPVTACCDLPAGLTHVATMPKLDGDFKPGTVPAWWSVDAMVRWLLCPFLDSEYRCTLIQPQPFSLWPNHEFHGAAEHDRRTHVKIDPLSGANDDGMLFQTTGIQPITERISTRVRGESTDVAEMLGMLKLFSEWSPLGGERRLVHKSVEKEDSIPEGWSCPINVANALANAKQVRMILSTPAIFQDGWKPGWLQNVDGQWIGRPPFHDPRILLPELRLCAAVVDRWLPISGWSYESDPNGKRPSSKGGPKPMVKMVAAGAVYYFEVIKPEEGHTLSAAWMQPMSDTVENRNDGFGLAVWGIWKSKEELQKQHD